MMNPMSDPVTSSLMSTGNQMSDPALIQSIFKVRLSLPFSIHSRLEHFLSLYTNPNVGFFDSVTVALFILSISKIFSIRFTNIQTKTLRTTLNAMRKTQNEPTQPKALFIRLSVLTCLGWVVLRRYSCLSISLWYEYL